MAETNDYYYDKYQMTYTQSAWQNTQYTADAWYGFVVRNHDYDIYSGFSVGNGSFDGSGKSVQNYQSLDGYYFTDYETTVYQIYPGKVSERYKDFNVGTPYQYTVHYVEYNARKAQITESKSLVESNIVAPDGTYPDDGRHSDGYFYVKKGLANMKPELAITSSDNIQLVDNKSMTITGTIKDNNVNDTVSVKYTLKKDNVAVSGFEGLVLTNVTANGSAQNFSGTIDLTSLANGNYTIDITANDNGNLVSSTVTKNFKVNSKPVLTVETVDNQVLNLGNSLSVSGSVQDSDTNETLRVKYSVFNSDGSQVANKQNIELLMMQSNGGSLTLNGSILFDSEYAEGSYRVDSFAEDSSGLRSDVKVINLTLQKLNVAPTVSTTIEDNIILNPGNTYDIAVDVNDVDVNDNITTKYTLYDDQNVVVPGHDNVVMGTVVSTGAAQSVNHQIDLSALTVNKTYKAEIWVADDKGSESSKLIRTFNYNEVIANVTSLPIAMKQGENKYVVINGSKLRATSNNKLVITYDVAALEAVDLYAMTWQKDLSVGAVSNSDVEILSFIPAEGKIEIGIDKTVESTKMWSGIADVTKFKALKAGNTIINYSIEQITN